MFNDFKNIIHFHKGLPNTDDFNGKLRTLLIINDLMSESDDSVANIFTKILHHRNVSIVFLSQNLFYKSKQNRTMSLNSHYMIIFKNPHDKLQIATLARQMYPNNSKFLVEAWNGYGETVGLLGIGFKTRNGWSI
jgi:hypothetical protein